MEVTWVGGSRSATRPGLAHPGLTLKFFLWIINPKITLNQYRYFGVGYNVYSVCIIVYTLLKVVNYYDLSVLFMSVMGFKTKSLDEGWVGGMSSIQVYFRFSEFF